MKVNKYLLPVLAVVLLLGTVWVAKAAGLWATGGRDQIMLDDSGRPDPQGIKGWMTLRQVSETYGVPLEDLYALIGVPAGVSPDTALKELEALVPGFSVWQVRELVWMYREENP